MRSEAALITGCSSGIGRATAQLFRQAGHPVYATARQLDSIADLAQAGAVTLALDVTDEDSMTAAVERVEEDHGAVGILVNNADYGLQGAIEAVSLDDVRRQFETNLFGQIRLTQLVLSAMRAQRRGRIINASAMGAYFSLPGTGILHASKHAVRATSAALRLELRPFGIAVSVVEPGPVRTAFAGKANATLPHGDSSGPYDRFHTEVAARLDAAYQPKITNMALSADTVAHVILKAARSHHPRARYPAGVMSRSIITLSRLLPRTAADALIRWQFPVPAPDRPETSTAGRATAQEKTMSELYDTIAHQLTSHLGVDPGLVNPDVTFAALDIDSLSMIELAIMVEDQCGIEIEGIDAESTLAQAVALLEEALRQQQASTPGGRQTPATP
jgi:short-subunit dehydrogenase/acyl carrier protein